MDPARLTPLFAAGSGQTPRAQRSSTDGFFWAITTDEPSIERQSRPLAEGRCDLPPNQQGERRPVGAGTSSIPDTSETTSLGSDEVVLYVPPARQPSGPAPKSKQRQAPPSTAALFSHKYGTSSHGTQGASADGIINRSQNTDVRWEYKIKSICVTPDWPSKLAEVQWNELKPKSENLGKGEFGSVSLFAAGNRLIAGKSAIGELKDAQGNPFDALLVELSRYATVYDKVGLHPNLCRVYGIGTVDLHGEPTRMLLMDAVPGSHA